MSYKLKFHFGNMTGMIAMRIFLTGLLVFMLSAPCIFAAEPNSPGARLAMDQYLGQAKTLLDQGKAEEAWRMLRNLVREEPDNIAVNILLSQAAFATGRDNQALSAIERVVELQPNNAALHWALARAYARAGDEAASASEMTEALRLDPNIANKKQQDDPGKAAKLSAGRYDRFKAAGRLALGLVWDSNATGGLDSLDVDIGPYTVHLNDDAEKKSSFGEYINGNLNWGWQLGEDSSWYLAGDFLFYGKKYNNNIPSNKHFTWGYASMGLRHIGEKHVFDVRGRVSNATFDPFDSMTGWGGEASFIYALLPNFQLIARAGIDSRAYMEYDGKDGIYGSAGLYGRLHFGGDRYSVLGGIKYIGASTEEARYSYDGFEAMLRLDLEVIRNVDFSPFIAWRQAQYHDASTALTGYFGEDNRSDNLLTTGCGLTWHIDDHVAIEAGWQYLKSYSNSPFYRYDQHQINTGIVFSF